MAEPAETKNPSQQRLVAVLDQLLDVLVDLGVPERIVDQASALVVAVDGLESFRGLDANTATELTEAIQAARPTAREHIERMRRELDEIEAELDRRSES